MRFQLAPNMAFCFNPYPWTIKAPQKNRNQQNNASCPLLIGFPQTLIKLVLEIMDSSTRITKFKSPLLLNTSL